MKSKQAIHSPLCQAGSKPMPAAAQENKACFRGIKRYPVLSQMKLELKHSKCRGLDIIIFYRIKYEGS